MSKDPKSDNSALDEEEAVKKTLSKLKIKTRVDSDEVGTSLTEAIGKEHKKGWKPDVSNLQNAIIDGKFVIPSGAKVVIEYTHEPSRDTTLWTVVKVFDTVPEGTYVQEGYIRLFDPEKGQYGTTNYKEADQHGLVMKVPDGSKRWLHGSQETLMEIVKRKKKRKKLVNEESETKQKTPMSGIVIKEEITGTEKKRRGRPKGSKNKSTLAKEAAKRA